MGTTEKIHLYSLIQIFIDTDGELLEPALRQAELAQLSASPCMGAYNHFCGPLLDPSRYIYAPFSKKSRTEQSTPDVALPVLIRGKRLSTSSIWQNSLMQGRIPLVFFVTRACCWLIFNLVSSRTSRWRTQSCLQLDSPQQPSSCTVQGFSFSDADFAFPLVGFHEVPITPFSSLSRFLWMIAQPSAVSASPHNLVWSGNSLPNH